jgi:hypothetical protein
MKKTGKIICGSCILLAMGIPIALGCVINQANQTIVQAR